AVKGGYTIVHLLYNPVIRSEDDCRALVPDVDECVEVSEDVYQRLAYRDGTEGILAVAKFKDFRLDELTFQRKNPLVLVAEAPEKPGNIGALLRTADAARLDAVIIANPKTDMFNPNIVRSSVGCLFTNQIATGTTAEVIQFLRKNGISIFCAALHSSSVEYSTINFTQPSAIVVGTEADGLSDEWLHQADSNIVIPMQGAIDSLNVSVAAGILIFEASRQRHFKS
ncbi:MAG: RNA methyltransferase, partial [Flavobacteriaceae bacterium]|nr:RNA methyltransferase [Flavobacteriaceae bacterium]